MHRIHLGVGLPLSAQPTRFAVRKQLFDLCRAGKLKPYVMATYPLARYMEALALVRDRKVIGKVVLTTGD